MSVVTHSSHCTFSCLCASCHVPCFPSGNGVFSNIFDARCYCLCGVCHCLSVRQVRVGQCVKTINYLIFSQSGSRTILVFFHTKRNRCIVLGSAWRCNGLVLTKCSVEDRKHETPQETPTQTANAR